MYTGQCLYSVHLVTQTQASLARTQEFLVKILFVKSGVLKWGRLSIPHNPQVWLGMSEPEELKKDKLSPEKALEHVKTLQDGQISFGPSSRAALVMHFAKGASSTDALKGILWPFGDGADFDAQSPTLASANLGPVKTVSQLVQLLIHELFCSSCETRKRRGAAGG